ncbi:MAG: biotin--[acetyl-CoA-carboxylase] ligase [Actinomycetota bacterium]|nr:biotin--[acetyl-CoA-carboxylase] ligase [Actinomycetota bacterium]
MDIDGRVLDLLGRETRFGDVRLVERTGSTNDVAAAEAAGGAPEGLVVSADFQSSGRGRLDRTWEARAGDGLLVSVLLRPAGLPRARRALVPSAVALAARAACREVAGVVPEIKWPNDLLDGEGAKLAGILAVESAGAVVVGLGLNVHGAPPGATCLDRMAGRRVERAELLVAWLRKLDPLLDRWDEVARRYRAECATVGRRVAVELAAGQVVTGTVEGVDDLGLLVLRDDDGSVSALAAGDVTHLRW